MPAALSRTPRRRRLRRALGLVVCAPVLLTALACGTDDEGGTGVTTDSTVSESPPGGGATLPAPTVTRFDKTPLGAACTVEAVEPVVRAVLSGPDAPTIAEVRLEECAGGYARAFAVPADAGFETEQLFLREEHDLWVILDLGTGLDCTDPDLDPQLEEACVALGLR